MKNAIFCNKPVADSIPRMLGFSVGRSAVVGLIASICLLLSPTSARAQLDASNFPAGAAGASTIRDLALTNDAATLASIINLEQSLKDQLAGATDAQKDTINGQLTAIGAGIAQAIAANPSTLATFVSLSQNLNGQLAGATNSEGSILRSQLAAIGSMLGSAVQSNPDLADQVQTGLVAAGVPGVNTAYAATTGNTVTAATGPGGGGGGGGGVGGPTGEATPSGGTGGGGSGGGSTGTGNSGGGLTGGGGSGGGSVDPGLTAGSVSPH